MNDRNDLTTGSVRKKIILFALPYMLSCFMQTFYGMADLFVIGLYNGSATTTAVSVGSQVMHMLTVIIMGIVMGATVKIGQTVGAKDEKASKEAVGTATVFFAVFAIFSTISLLFFVNQITAVMLTPQEAVQETADYLKICFAGIPFITAYNVISGIFRGVGDSKRPMYFVAVACIVNVALDFVLVGGFGLGARGASLGTVCGQAVSVAVSLFMMRKLGLGFRLTKKDFRIKGKTLRQILSVGIPISMQDGLIQVAFIVITVIANSRGLIFATSVGIVEKLISFMFLVPSAFLSAISAFTAQNMGAGKPDRAKTALRWGLMITVSWGMLCFVYNQFLPHTLVGMFSNVDEVVLAGSDYLKAYALDCVFASVHFCFSGYFCGNQKSLLSFIHNIASIVLVRVPGAYFASVLFPETLYPMGLMAPLGSLLSALLCVGFFVHYERRAKNGTEKIR